MSRVRIPRLLALAVVAGLLVGLLAGCGGSSKKSSKKPLTAVNGKVTIEAHDIFYNTNEIDASPGPLTITLENKGGGLHTFTMDNPKVDIEASAGQSKSSTVNLTPGTYTFYCKVPGHRALGMQGQLVVK